MTSFKFAGTWVVATSLFIFFVCLVLWKVFLVTSEDQIAYAHLVQEANPINSSTKVGPYTAQQQRKGVQKDVLLMQGNERLQLRLTSQEAVMIFDHQVDETQLIEKMHGVKCWMQEELFYLLPDGREALLQDNGKLLIRHEDPQNRKGWVEASTKGVKPMQILRYLEADDAVYFYKSEQVVAENVQVSRFILPGHTLIDDLTSYKPHIKGKAKKVEFSLSGKEINFKAYQLKASFSGKGD